jgi:hypothetical protein
MTKKTLAVLIIAVAVLVQPCVSVAQSDWEYYFFGVNLEAFKDSNWLMVATGAVTSMLAHELGHALYLESQGKDWNVSASSSGLAVHTNNHLTDNQYRNFGRSGFAFQAGIGAVLTSFKNTKHLDFTKGWTSMNAAQLYTYEQREHDNSDDFKLIERGNGDQRLDYCSLALITQNNLLAIKSSSPILSHVSEIEEKGETPSAWHFDIAIGQGQAKQRAWVPPKANKLSLQQVKAHYVDYAVDADNMRKNSL